METPLKFNDFLFRLIFMILYTLFSEYITFSISSRLLSSFYVRKIKKKRKKKSEGQLEEYQKNMAYDNIEC